jgi:hypothetical protein
MPAGLRMTVSLYYAAIVLGFIAVVLVVLLPAYRLMVLLVVGGVPAFVTWDMARAWIRREVNLANKDMRKLGFGVDINKTMRDNLDVPRYACTGTESYIWWSRSSHVRSTSTSSSSSRSRPSRGSKTLCSRFSRKPAGASRSQRLFTHGVFRHLDIPDWKNPTPPCRGERFLIARSGRGTS